MLLDPPEASRGKRGRSCAYRADRLPVSVGPHYGPRRMAAVVGSLKVISSNRKRVQRVADNFTGPATAKTWYRASCRFHERCSGDQAGVPP